MNVSVELLCCAIPSLPHRGKPGFTQGVIVRAGGCDTYILRFAVCSRFTLETDIQLAWQEILNQVGQMEVKK